MHKKGCLFCLLGYLPNFLYHEINQNQITKIKSHKNDEIHKNKKTIKYIRNLQNNKIPKNKFGIYKFDHANMFTMVL